MNEPAAALPLVSEMVIVRLWSGEVRIGSAAIADPVAVTIMTALAKMRV